MQGSPQFLVAATRLAYCRISYHQMNPDTQFFGGGWVDSWKDPDLPGAIHIELAPAVPDPIRLPVVSVTALLHLNRDTQDPPYEDQ